MIYIYTIPMLMISPSSSQIAMARKAFPTPFYCQESPRNRHGSRPPRVALPPRAPLAPPRPRALRPRWAPCRWRRPRRLRPPAAPAACPSTPGVETASKPGVFGWFYHLNLTVFGSWMYDVCFFWQNVLVNFPQVMAD